MEFSAWYSYLVHLWEILKAGDKTNTTLTCKKEDKTPWCQHKRTKASLKRTKEKHLNFIKTKEKMTEENTDYSETTLFVLLGTLLTGIIGGISWLCRNKCRNQQCDISSGCCHFHSDSRLRETIRNEIERDRSERDTESQLPVPTD